MTERAITQASFNAFLGEHTLMGSECKQCRKQYLPPRPFCPDCHSNSVEWVELPATGTLTAFTTVHIGPKAMIEAGYDRKNPFCVGIVQLDGGPAISAQILGVDPASPDSIKIGTHLKVNFVDRGDGDERQTFLGFEAVDA